MLATRPLTTAVLVASGAALLASVVATPASARPEPAPVTVSVQSADDGRCPLERVGIQFVRCDDLTGAGVAAPAYVPERG